jgi:hypothetical protein
VGNSNAVLPYLLDGKDLFNLSPDLSTAEGRREQAVRLAVAAHMLPRDAATEKKLHRIMLILQERERQRPVRRSPAALVARQADARVAEALADAPSGPAVDRNQSATATGGEALRGIA